MQKPVLEIKSIRYYQLINVNFGYALYITSGSEKFVEQKASLFPPNDESLGQIWQIVRIPDNILYKNCYEIVHTRSTLVLTRRDQNQVKLKFGQCMSSQMFFIEQLPQGNIRFISYQNNQWSLYFDNNTLKSGPISANDKKCQWLIKPCINNPIINRSCYFQNAFSGLVIDVPRASTSNGCALIQYSINNRFNQRFNIFYYNKYFKIANLNSKMFLTAHKKCRQGDKITQQEDLKSDPRQHWRIEYQGKNLYVIRSELNPKMMIGIHQNDYSFEGMLITSEDDQYCEWKIVGHLPQRKQLGLA